MLLSDFTSPSLPPSSITFVWQTFLQRIELFYFGLLHMPGSGVIYDQHTQKNHRVTLCSQYAAAQTENDQNKQRTTLLNEAPGNPISQYDTRHDWAGSGECCPTFWALTDTVYTNVKPWLESRLPSPDLIMGVSWLTRTYNDPSLAEV